MNTAIAKQQLRLQRVLAPLWSPWGLTLLLLALVAISDPAGFAPVTGAAVASFATTAPYIAAAVLFIAWVKAASAESMIAGVFEGRETRAIILAALIGGLAPFCSCQVIPFIAALLAVGTPLSAVMAFWLSSPLVDPPTLLITAGALGWDFAIGKAAAAVGLGLAGGFAMRALIARGAFTDALRIAPAKSCCGSGASSQPAVQWRFWSDASRRDVFRGEAAQNTLFLVKWLVLAYVLEAMLIRYVPAEMVASILGGNGLLQIVTGALVGMPAYLNGYVAAPLLAGLIEQGMSRGAAMAFMISGPVSCIPAMAAVWALVRPPVFAAYIIFGFIGAVVGGVIFAGLF